MDSIQNRRISIVAAVLFIGLGWYGYQYIAAQKEAPPQKETETRLKRAESMPVELQTIATTLDLEGQLAAYDKIELYAEVGGAVTATGRSFKVGTYFPKGSSLIRIDDTETRLALLAQKSTLLNAIAQAMPDLKIDYPESFPQWEDYLNNFDVEKPIAALPSPQSDREKRFIAARNLLTQYYNIQSQEKRLEKYALKAPFSGVLTEANIQPGTVIRVGQKLGELMATGTYELVATVPLDNLNYIKVGNAVELQSEDIAGTWTGKIKRISDQIDPNSQTVQVFVGVQGKALREGMYLRGTAASRVIENAIKLPRELIVNQDQVYEVSDSTLQLRDISIVRYAEQHVIVTGLPADIRLLKRPLPGSFNGMKVAVK
ncbi:MAG: efflux RND transporter periplasmic adaptor subunit [Bacteroidota bacterium]